MNKKPGFSAGTILTLCLTAAVVVGCIFLFGKIRGQSQDVRMDAQRVLGVFGAVTQRDEAEASPLETVSTVTVTLAPITQAPVTQAPAAVSPTPAPAVTAAPQQRYSFSLTAGGLMEFDSDVSDTVYKKEDKSIDYRPIVSPVSAKICADLNLAFLPQVINVTDLKYGDFLVPNEVSDALRTMGFDQVSIATEHVLDQGAQGAADTVAALAEKGLSCTGVNIGAAFQHQVLPLNGANIAILSYTDVLTAKSKNALSAQADLMKPFDLNTVRQDIQAARAQGARCVIVCLYWGRADAAAVTERQKETARSLSEMGADIILGARSSRVLPMERINCIGEDGRARETFVAYSLGTLLSESREAYDIAGLLLHLNVTCDENGRVKVDTAEYTPTYVWRQTVEKKMQYRILCSADPAPAGMSTQQTEVMQRALTRIQNTLKDSPVAQRR